MNLSCIVCAIDSADTSPAVLASAMALAAWDNAELHLVYLDGASEPGFQAPSVVAPHHETTVVRGGDPVTAVVDHARRVRADLIVVGATLAARGALTFTQNGDEPAAVLVCRASQHAEH